MHSKAIKAFLIALIAFAASGQTPVPEFQDRVFYFTHTRTEQDVQEISIVIRSTADVRKWSVDAAQKSLTVRGTAEQIALAQWLFDELDKPIDRPQRQDSTPNEYRMPGNNDDVARVFYLPQSGAPEDVQDLATVIRSMSDLRLGFTYVVRRAVILRGTAGQLALAEWLFNELTKPSQKHQHSTTREFQVTPNKDDVARVLFMGHAATFQDLQEIATLIYSITDIRRAFTYTSPRALTLRATADQIALAEWLFNELDTPVGRQPLASKEYLTSGGGKDVVQVFHLTGIESPQRLQEFAVQIRSATGVPRLFTYNAPRALAVGGTVDQVASAERLIRERVKPD